MAFAVKSSQIDVAAHDGVVSVTFPGSPCWRLDADKAFELAAILAKAASAAELGFSLNFTDLAPPLSRAF